MCYETHQAGDGIEGKLEDGQVRELGAVACCLGALLVCDKGMLKRMAQVGSASNGDLVTAVVRELDGEGTCEQRGQHKLKHLDKGCALLSVSQDQGLASLHRVCEAG